MGTKSPFSELERAAGAVFQTYGGLELPEKTLDPMAEYEVARTAAGLFDLSFRGCLRFTGADRTTFLHNMLSNDINALRSGQGCYATVLTQQSKIVADAAVFCLEDAFLLELDLRFKDRAREHLEKYLVADEVEIEDSSGSETVLGVHGPRAADVLRAVLGEEALPEVEYEHRPARLAGVAVSVARVSWTGDPGFDVNVPRESAEPVWREIAKAGEPFALRPIGMVAFNVLRVEAGIPWLGVDFDDSHLVLEAGLEHGISFTKGCYLGQEVVERTLARGHINRRLVGLRIEARTVPHQGAKILKEGVEVGRVTSAVFSPAVGSPIAMGYVKRDLMEPGNRLQVEQVTGNAPAEVVAMPFFRR